MIRNLVRLLVLMLVPVLIVSVPNVATAATVEQSAGVEWDIGGLSIGGFGGLECDATVTTWTYKDRADIQVGGLDCYGGPDASPGFSQPGEPGSSFVVWVTGTDCGGSASGVFDAGSEDGAWMVHGSYGGAGWTMGPPTCDPATLCLKVDGAGSIRQGCSPVDLGPATATQDNGVCTYAEFTTPNVSAAITTGVSVKRYQRYGSVPALTQELGPTEWRVYHVIANKTTGALVLGAGSTYAQGTTSRNMPGSSPYNSSQTNTSTNGSSGGAAPPPEDLEIVGIGIIRWPTVGHSGALNYLPQQASYGRVGVNNPGLCQFYWGRKIAVTSDGTDVPQGDLLGVSGPVVAVPDPYVAPPAAQEEGCAGFSWTDPASWGGAGSCMMVALLQRALEIFANILDAIKGLASAIVGGILGGLSALFVPSDGFMANKSDQMRDAWGSTPPAVFIDSAQVVGDSLMVSSPGGGCAGPDWTFTPPIADGPVTLHPFSTCEGAMGTIATIVRAALTAGVYVGGFLVALRVVAAAFGVQLNFGRGDES